MVDGQFKWIFCLKIVLFEELNAIQFQIQFQVPDSAPDSVPDSAPDSVPDSTN